MPARGRYGVWRTRSGWVPDGGHEEAGKRAEKQAVNTKEEVELMSSFPSFGKESEISGEGISPWRDLGFQPRFLPPGVTS